MARRVGGRTGVSSQSEAVASQPQPEASQPQAEATSSTRVVRGANRCTRLQRRKDKIPIVLNDYSQPIGNSQVDLTHYTGLIARDGQRAPINYTDWRHIPKEKREAMIDCILTRFEWSSQKGRDWINKKLSEQWRNWKHTLKKDWFNPSLSIQALLSLRPKSVDREQWKGIVEFWKSDEATARSVRNKANRQKQTIPHTGGTKSFARYRAEEKNKNPEGRSPDRMEMYKLTHTRKNNTTFVNQEAEAQMDAMDEVVTQQPAGTDSSTARNIAFTRVMGSNIHGRCKGFGLGVTPTDLSGGRGQMSEELMAEKAKRMALEEKVEQNHQMMTNTISSMQQMHQESLQQMQQQMKQKLQEHWRKLVASMDLNHDWPSFNVTPSQPVDAAIDSDETQGPDDTQQ